MIWIIFLLFAGGTIATAPVWTRWVFDSPPPAGPSLEQRMAKADKELYAVAPELAVELGYVPPEERPVTCAYCDETHKQKDMATHQEFECELAAKAREQEQEAARQAFKRAQEKKRQLQELAARQQQDWRLMPQQSIAQMNQADMLRQRRAAQRGLYIPPASHDLFGTLGDAIGFFHGRGI